MSESYAVPYFTALTPPPWCSWRGWDLLPWLEGLTGRGASPYDCQSVVMASPFGHEACILGVPSSHFLLDVFLLCCIIETYVGNTPRYLYLKNITFYDTFLIRNHPAVSLPLFTSGHL